ncbi:MAG: ArdC family protein, partial [Steroidobacteraceae bacterium]|nr:ArdC family protein [Steroidobacteraceae bacterium]
MNARPQTDTRNTIDALLETLKERLAAPGASLLPLLTTMSRFSKYSLWNQMLIFAQRPDATHVMGYRAWNKAGYQVRKGEHGIALYAPMLFKTRDSASDPDDANTTTPRLGFRVAYVFDVSQVDAQPGAAADMPGTEPALDTAGTACPNAHRANEQLKAFLFGHNVELEYKRLQPGLLGYTNGRRITCATGQPTHVEFGTLIHETTHLLLHVPRDGSPRPDLTTRETEAEAVTFLLCAQL